MTILPFLGHTVSSRIQLYPGLLVYYYPGDTGLIMTPAVAIFMAINHPDYGLQCYLLPNSHTGSPGLNYTTLHSTGTCVLLAKPFQHCNTRYILDLMELDCYTLLTRSLIIIMGIIPLSGQLD